MKRLLAVPCLLGALALAGSILTACPPGDDDDDNDTTSSSSGGGGGGCADNATKEKAAAFTLGTATNGKACYGNSYYFWKVHGGPWNAADKFTVVVNIKGNPSTTEIGTLSFGLGTDGTWGQAEYATDPTSLPSGTTQTSTKVDIEPVDTDGAQDLYFIVSPSLYLDKSIEFDFKVTKQ